MTPKERSEHIVNECLAAMNDVLVKHGMVAESKGFRYTDTYITPKFQIMAVGTTADGRSVLESPERLAFQRLTGLGKKYPTLRPDMLDKKFTLGNSRYQITGLRRTARTYPVLATRISDDAPFKFPVSHIERAEFDNE